LNHHQIVSSPLAGKAAIAYYRNCVEYRLGHSITSSEWQAMLDIGDFVNVLRNGVFRAWFATNERVAEYRIWDEEYVGNVNQIVRRAMPWLL
ncbi:MAG: hypothetical protein KDD83_13350, partial [Caldilineaceae bacterium]|nr:hypothetical protein [Caldilineaceae bacterium]